MSAFESERRARHLRPTVIVSLIIIIGLLGAAYYLAPRFEREAPQIKLTPDSDVLGRAPLNIIVTDRGAGLKSLTVTLSSGGSEQTLASEQYSPPNLFARGAGCDTKPEDSAVFCRFFAAVC